MKKQLLIALATALLLAGALFNVLPRTFQSTATLQLNREGYDWKQRGNTPISIDTEITMITSKEILQDVVDRLTLDERWELSNAQALTKLSKQVESKAPKGTDLITITSWDTDPEMACHLADAVATAYQARRRAQETTRAQKVLATLQMQLKDQQDKVEEARLRMIEVAERYGIVDLPKHGVSVSRALTPGGASKAEAVIAQITKQLKALKELEGDPLLQNAVLLDLTEPTLQSLWPTYQQFQLEKEGLLNAGLEAEHPSIVRVERQIVQTRQRLESTVEDIQKTLATKVAIAEKALKSLEPIGERRDGDLDERRKVAEYAEARKSYELQKTHLANMQAKFTTEQVGLTMPQITVTMHEGATVAAEPVHFIRRLALVMR